MIVSDVSTPAASTSLIAAQGNGQRLWLLQNRLKDLLQEILAENVATGNFTNGRRVFALEQAFRAYLNEQAGVDALVSDVVALNSGTTCLRAAIEAFRFPAESEIIVPALSFISTAYAVSDACSYDEQDRLVKGGLLPVFVDIDPHTYTLDPQCVRNAITERTVAVIPVHLLGQMADMSAIKQIADEYHLALIEDAAQAHGASSQEAETGLIWPAGSIGDVGCFSMNSVKNIGALGDAGLLTISRHAALKYPYLSERIRAWRDTGRRPGGPRYQHDMWGTRGRLDEFAAAIILDQLPLLEGWNALRRSIAARYSTALKGTGFKPPFIAPGRTHAFFSYVVEAPFKERERLENKLRQSGIEVAAMYTNLADQPWYREGRLPCRISSHQQTQRIIQSTTLLPCYPELEESQIERVESLLLSLC